MVEAVRKLAQLGVQLTVEERNLLSVAYKVCVSLCVGAFGRRAGSSPPCRPPLPFCPDMGNVLLERVWRCGVMCGHIGGETFPLVRSAGLAGCGPLPRSPASTAWARLSP